MQVTLNRAFLGLITPVSNKTTLGYEVLGGRL